MTRARSSFASVALAVAWRTLHNVFTTPAIIIPSTAFPLMFFAAFAGGLSRIADAPGFDFPAGYTAFQFVFVLLQSAAFGGVFTGFGIARDFEHGFARRLLLAAPNRVGIIAGYALAALVRWLFTGSVVFTAALLSGMQILGGGVDFFALIVLALLVNVAGLLWACGVAMRIRSIQGGPLMQTPVFLILFLAPVYVPLDLLADWLQTIAQANPMTALLEAGRGLIVGRQQDTALAFGTVAALVAGFALWAYRGLRSAERAGA